MSELIGNKIQPAEKAAGGVTGNLTFLIWSGGVNIANSVLLWIFIARWRSPEELGGFTVAMGLYALFYNICSLGLSPFLVNEISRRREKSLISERESFNSNATAHFIGNAALFLSASGLICAVLMAVSVFFLTDSAVIRMGSLILSFALVPTGAIVLSEATAISFGRARLIAIVTTLENTLRTVIPLILLLYGSPLWLIYLSFAAVRFIALAIYLFTANKHLSFFNYDRKEIAALVKVAPIFAGTVVLASLNWQLPIILLARLSSANESASYGIASRFLIPAAIFAASYAGAIQPALVREFEKSRGAAAVYLRRMAGYSLILTTVSAVLAPFLSVMVLTNLFGERYSGAARTLDILAASVVPFALTIIVARGLILINAQRVDLIANAFGVVIGITAGLVLVPRYGAVGGAAAQLISFGLIAAIIIVYLSVKLKEFRFGRTAAFISSIWK